MLKNDDIKIMQNIYEILVDRGLDQNEDTCKPVDEFRRLIKRELRLKKRVSEKSNQYNKDHKEERKEYNKHYRKKYYEENKSKLQKYQKEYYKKKRNERLLNELEDA